jgi:hypothetical protein
MKEPEGGPIATEIGIAEGDPATLMSVSADKPIVIQDPGTHLSTGVYNSLARFTLRLKATTPSGQDRVRVLMRFQSCNDVTCLPPRTESIEVPIKISE